MNKIEYIKDILTYVKTNSNYDKWTKEEAMEGLLLVLLEDMGAVQGFLNAIGVNHDMYHG